MQGSISFQPKFGTLKVTGFLRGRILNVNNLVHLPGWGDFQMSQIDAPQDPYPLIEKVEKNKKKQVGFWAKFGQLLLALR